MTIYYQISFFNSKQGSRPELREVFWLERLPRMDMFLCGLFFLENLKAVTTFRLGPFPS